MIIHAYILCFNEEMILPFTLDYYTKFCEQVFLLDNESTDKSREIAEKYPNVTVISWSSNNQINDYLYVEIKSNVYKRSRGSADWVIVCDCDEFLLGVNELDTLKPELIDLPIIQGYQMISDHFPTYTGESIISKITTGFRDKDFDKQIIFNPNIDITFGIGAHAYQSDGKKDTLFRGLKLLHYKYLGVEYINYKNQRSKARLSDWNKVHGFGSHYMQDLDDVKKTFQELKERSSTVL